MTDALARARADLAAGQAWKARDRLTGVMSTRTDDEVLDLLGEVYFQMGDLPAAGSLWFVTGRNDESAQAAIAAWHERFRGAEARWHSVPRARRMSADEAHLKQLQHNSQLAARARWDMKRERVHAADRVHSTDWEGIVIMTVVFVVLALMAIGAVTVLRWIFA